MTFEELLKNRRSIRSYQDKEIPTELIQAIINESICAPSAGNEQPWEFIIVNRKEIVHEISDECKINMLARIAANPNDHAKKYEKMLQKGGFNIFYNAPAVVFILGQESFKNLHVDCALLASYFMMSATSRGLGTCWVNFGREIKNPEMLKKLGIGVNYKIIAPIALGYPEHIPALPKRREPRILNVIE